MKLKFSVHNDPNVPSVLKVPAFIQMIQAGHIMPITLDYHGDIHLIPNAPIVSHVLRVPSVVFVGLSSSNTKWYVICLQCNIFLVCIMFLMYQV